MTGVIQKSVEKLHIKMQQFLINYIGQPFTLINTTQLSNFAVIKITYVRGEVYRKLNIFFIRK